MIFRAVVCIVVFCAALLGAGTLLSEFQPFAGVPTLEQKFVWFAAHADEYDTVFIGTSRIHRGVKPVVFDEVTAAAGMPTRSFNFGADAMIPPEDAYVLEHIARLRPKRLRWVFIETAMFRRDAGFGGDESMRNIHWHDTTRTLQACRAVLTPPDGKRKWGALFFGSAEERQPFAQAGSHARSWLTRTLNAGRGSLLLQSGMQQQRTKFSPVLGRSRDGYMPSGDGQPLTGAPKADYERRFAEQTAKGSRISSIDPDAQASLDRMLRRVGDLGARPVLLLPPFLHPARFLPKPGGPAAVFDYSDIEKWPALYQIEHRTDHSHVNSTGADLFTRAIAADFIELARGSAAPR